MIDPENKNCPICGYSLDAHTRIDDSEPVEPTVGDISFCFNCSSLLEFNQGLRLVIPSAETVSGLNNNPVLMAQISAIRLAIKNKPSQN